MRLQGKEYEEIKCLVCGKKIINGNNYQIDEFNFCCSAKCLFREIGDE